jgi:Zincin-like metallopeptidase
MRDAANLWAALRDARGVDGRDAVWSHPDLVPTSADLDDPLGFVAGESRSEGEENADFDTALEELLKGESNEGDENPGS